MPNKRANDKNEEGQGFRLEILQVLEKLEKEVQLLSCEKKKLLDAEKVLIFLLNEKIEVKTKSNQKLRIEINQQRTSCIELARLLHVHFE